MKTPSLKDLVDQNTYDIWVKMLGLLGPDGRTHRISVVVAGMLQYAYEMYLRNLDDDEDNKLGVLMLSAFECDYEERQESLAPVVKELFRDAGLRWEKTNSRGQGYSVIESTLNQFYQWHDMPWK